jgi:hypothetical protein
MTLKEIVDRVTWSELRHAEGSREFMERSLADLKRLPPRRTAETSSYSLHFEKDGLAGKGEDGEVYGKYHSYVLKDDYDGRIGAFETAWDEMLPMEVKLGAHQDLSDVEMLVAVIWDLTWKGATLAECKRGWAKYFAETRK